MTLNYKYCDLIDKHNGYDNKLHADRCEQIADDYAIEFSEWCVQWRVEFCDDTTEGILYTYGGMHQKYKMQELLKICKKEKGW